MVAILDIGIGNVRSIGNAFEKIGVKCTLTKSYKEVISAQGLIIPGVGSFGSGAMNLRSADLEGTINDFILTGKSVLGICLGMQLLFTKGFEFGEHDGLGLIDGAVDRMIVKKTKLPHIGWNSIRTNHEFGILAGLDSKEFYFVHSYCGRPKRSEDIAATCVYGEYEFCAAVEKENVFGVQFHPEKSGPNGLKLLENFTK